MKKYLVLLASASVLIAACSKPVPDEFSLSKNEISAASEENTYNIAVTANCSWAVTNAAEWITVNPMEGKGDGTIAVKVSANDGDDRTASFTVKGGSLEPVSVTVTQSGAPSKLQFGTPSMVGDFKKGKASDVKIEIPYTGSNGKESVEFTVEVASTYGNESNKGIELTKYTHNSFAKGNGKVSVPVNGTPEVLGHVTIVVKAGEAAVGSELEARVSEVIPYTNYIVWNPWAAGYTRKDFTDMIGGPFDKSWTNYGKDETLRASTNASDHMVLATAYSSDDFKEAYLTAVAAKPITAGGTVTSKVKVDGVSGYTLNPGIQIQGLAKDDYFLFVIPVKSAAAGTKVKVTASLGGAAAAAGYFILEYSLDKNNWAVFPDAKSITVSEVEYKYHFEDTHSTDKTVRYTYTRDASVDAGIASYTLPLPGALSNATAYLRLRAVGLNGSSAVMTKTGWSDIKYFEVSFE